jgi:uncharacterized protein (TIGR02246 family)
MMSTLWPVLTGVAIAVSLMGGVASAQAGAGGAQKADPAVVKVADAYVAAMKARDAAKVAELYMENAVEMPPHQKPVRGRANIQKYYEQQFKDDSAEFSGVTLNRTEARTSGNIGYDTGQYSQRITPKGGKPIEDTGNYIVILHQAEGQWRVAYAIYNSHLPPPGTPAAKQP